MALWQPQNREPVALMTAYNPCQDEYRYTRLTTILSMYEYRYVPVSPTHTEPASLPAPAPCILCSPPCSFLQTCLAHTGTEAGMAVPNGLGTGMVLRASSSWGGQR